MLRHIAIFVRRWQRPGGARQMLETDGSQFLPPRWLGTRSRQLELGQWRQKVPGPAAEANTLFPTTHTQLWNPQIWSRTDSFFSSL